MPDLPDDRRTSKAVRRTAISSLNGPDQSPAADGSGATSGGPQRAGAGQAGQLQREIAGRKRAEEERRAEAARYRTLFELVPVAVYTTDANGVIQEFNHRAVELWGRVPRGTDEKFCGSTKMFHPDGRSMPHEQCPVARVLCGEKLEPKDLEIVVEQAGGERRTVLVAPRALIDARGRIIGAINCFHDITSRKQMEAALRQSEQSFRMVTDKVPQLIWTNNGKGVADYFNRRWYEYTGLSYQQSVGLGWEAIVHPEDAPGAKEQWREALATRKEFEAEYRLRRHDGAYRWHIGRNAPMHDGDGQVISWFGTATDIQDLKQAEAALRETEARFRAMFEQANVGIVQIDSNGRFISVNSGFCAIVGYTEEELREMRVPDVTDPDDWQREAELTRQLTAGEISEYTIEKRYRRKDGRVVWGSMTATFVRGDSGQALYTLAIVQAITERKAAEEQLRFSEERFRQFAENSADLFWIVDVATQRIEYLNPVFEIMWGEPRETVIRDINRWSELVHPDDRENAASAMPRTLDGETVTIEYRIVRPSDSAVRWLRDTGFPIRDENGRITRVAGVARDVTEDKHRNAALRENEERYRLLVDGARDYAIFMVNPSNEIVYWSAGAERVFGWSAEEAVGQSGELVFTPEDRAREQEEKEIEIALNEGCASDRRWHIRKDGTRIWVDGVMRRLEDEENGALRGFAKIARDATEQRRAEDELHRAHEELEQRVRERTAELRAKNRLLQSEIGRRQMLEREILRITERERARIGQDLHDSLCQELTATAFLLKSRAKAISAQSKPAADSLTEAAETVNANAGLARDLARGLHPFELGAAGLPSALRELCGRTNESISCRCDCPRSLRLAQNVAVNLYRIAQEAMLNAVKHAKASGIVVCLERTNGEIVLTVSDDGQGTRRRVRGLGTHIMEYRARAAGGTLQVESTRGRGTSVTCRVPLKK